MDVIVDIQWGFDYFQCLTDFLLNIVWRFGYKRPNVEELTIYDL